VLAEVDGAEQAAGATATSVAAAAAAAADILWSNKHFSGF
jgi:hypothetical protein